jgi:hypothetical protein
MATTSKYFCDKCGEEDSRCIVAHFKACAGYEVEFLLCTACKIDAFEDFVKSLKSYERLERNYKNIRK